MCWGDDKVMDKSLGAFCLYFARWTGDGRHCRQRLDAGRSKKRPSLIRLQELVSDKLARGTDGGLRHGKLLQGLL